MTDQAYAKIEAFLKKANPSKAQEFPYAFKFVVLTGSGPKAAVVDAKNLKVTKGDGPADVTFTSDEATLVALLTQKTTVKEGISSGKIVIEGDKEIAKKLEPLIAKVNAS